MIILERVQSLSQTHVNTYTMNLALIDPFQLAQDSPDALTNDLSTYTNQNACLAFICLVHMHRG